MSDPRSGDQAAVPAAAGYQDPRRLIHLLDSALRPVPVGVPGEIYLAREQLARGYLNRPGLTAERFVADPFTPGARMYRTGDRAAWREDGVLTYIGRVDSQVKVRGFRIELGEIEAVLGAHPSVAQAVVVAREGRPGTGATTRLVAYVVSAPGELFDIAELRAYLAKQLPDYMLPAALVSMDRLPTTPNGKLDRAALPEPVFTFGVYRAPRTAAEETLATLFAEVLGLDRIGIDDDFLGIGGDSIRSIQVVSRARALGVQVTQRQIFERRTVARLSEVVVVQATGDDGSASAGSEVARGALVAAGEDQIESWEKQYPGFVDVWPLTSLQSGLLFHSMMSASDPNAGGDAYLMQLVYHLSGTVDPARMQAAGQQLLERYANLRVAFVAASDGDLVQVVPGAVRLPWQELDFSDLSEDEREAAFETFLVRDRAATFDPTAPPLLRLSLVKLAEDRFELVLAAHHALFDGWSEPILEQDLLRLYASGGDEAALQKAENYRDFVAWLSHQDHQASAQAWTAELAGVREPTNLGPALKPGSAQANTDAAARVEIVEIGLSAQEAVGLSRRAAELGVTVNTLVQGAWGTVLAALTGRDDVVFGATVSGRPPALAGVDKMVGLFINTLPVRVHCKPAENLAAVLTSLQSRQVALLDHHYFGLTEIHRAVGLSSLFDTLVVFESYPTDKAGTAEAYAAAGLEFTGLRRFSDTNFPLVLGAYADPHLRLGLQYRCEAVDSAVVRDIADFVLKVLRQILADPQVQVGSVELLTPAAREQWDLRFASAPEPDRPATPEANSADQSYRPPRNRLEEQLCTLLAEVLELDRVGIDDDFFALGGNSLHATRIINRIHTELGTQVSLRMLFQYSTIAKLSDEWPGAAAPSRPQLRKMTRE